MIAKRLLPALLLLAAPALPPVNAADTPAGFASLFNGKDLAGWRVPPGDNGHWKVVDGVIDYDAQSESTAEDKSLWSEKEFGNFVLRVDWRIKETPYVNPNVHIVKPDGSSKRGPDGKPVLMAVPDSDSGIYLRGESKAQVNIWCWPVGSGEVYGYRTDEKQPASVRAGVTPKKLADRNVGEWNTFEITVKGNRLSVLLNGEQVLDNAELPALPARGRIALQHHGSKKDGVWNSPPALVQFRNIAIKELPN
jgi:3-keto-disaccharide hydrolase